MAPFSSCPAPIARCTGVGRNGGVRCASPHGAVVARSRGSPCCGAWVLSGAAPNTGCASRRSVPTVTSRRVSSPRSSRSATAAAVDSPSKRRIPFSRDPGAAKFSTDAARWEWWTACAVARMLASQRLVAREATSFGFPDFLRSHLRVSFGGRIKPLAQYLGVGWNTVDDWVKGKRAPSLDFLLAVCMRLRAAPLGVVLARCSASFWSDPLPSSAARPSWPPIRPRASLPRSSRRRPDPHHLRRTARALREILRARDAGCRSATAVAKRLGVSGAFLKQHFPREHAQLRSLNQQYRAWAREERFRVRRGRLRAAVAELVREGAYPSKRKAFARARLSSTFSPHAALFGCLAGSAPRAWCRAHVTVGVIARLSVTVLSASGDAHAARRCLPDHCAGYRREHSPRCLSDRIACNSARGSPRDQSPEDWGRHPASARLRCALRPLAHPRPACYAARRDRPPDSRRPRSGRRVLLVESVEWQEIRPLNGRAIRSTRGGVARRSLRRAITATPRSGRGVQATACGA